MAFTDLHEGILEEFAGYAGQYLESATAQEDLWFTVDGHTPEARARELVRQRERRAERRKARAEARPPCPHCGAKVTRDPGARKLPTYCTPKCGRAARFKRWYESKGRDRRMAERARSQC